MHKDAALRPVTGDGYAANNRADPPNARQMVGDYTADDAAGSQAKETQPFNPNGDGKGPRFLSPG